MDPFAVRSIMYKVEKIFTDDQITALKHMYNGCEPQWAHQDYNLFDVEKRLVRQKIDVDFLNSILENYTGRQSHSHYFLKYVEDSFTRLHTDNVDDVGMTVVTYIDSQDLVGGHALAFETYDKRERPTDRYAKRKNEQAPIGKDIIPVVIEAEVGDSIVYGKELRHGVSQVSKGYRTVLISWFK